MNFDAAYFIYATSIDTRTLTTKMNSAFAKVSNLKVNRVSKIGISLASSTFLIYALGQSPIFKNIIASYFSCSG